MSGGRNPSAAATGSSPSHGQNLQSPANGGHFLLRLLQRTPSGKRTPPADQQDHFHPQFQDPAVAAVGPSHPFPPWAADPCPRPLVESSSFSPSSHSFQNVYPQDPWSSPLDLRNPQFSPPVNAFHTFSFSRALDAVVPPHQIQQFLPHMQIREAALPERSNALTIGSLKCEIRPHNGLPSGGSRDSKSQLSRSSRHLQDLPAGRNFRAPAIRPNDERTGTSWTNSPPSRTQKAVGVDKRRPLSPPIGKLRRTKMPNEWASLNGRLAGEHGREKGDFRPKMPFGVQLDRPGPPSVSNLQSHRSADIEESLTSLCDKTVSAGHSPGIRRPERMISSDDREIEDEMLLELIDSFAVGDEQSDKNAERKKDGPRVKEFRSDMSRGNFVSSQRLRNRRKEFPCRRDIESFSSCFLSIYASLIPADEEKDKQKRLLSSLEKLVNKEWPKAQLYLYGSCANSFGVSKSDIDICLTLNEDGIIMSDILLKLAKILELDNLQNVQALTRARVPIVKLMDPVTNLSCDICINNALAVVNTKLLRDYAQIDVRLRQLAFIVKHWAKLRGVNETYRGTLSSYAYVLMCIHFLQSRKPAILPCLQEMKATYVVTVDDVECAYFDQVEELRDFGAQNKESVAFLVWAFFDYWAYHHDYANAVISVRTGSILSKREKDWTRRIGNDRHLICIEDPFEINHDLGRVVDKYSIRILREEFERAADVMQFDPNPSTKLFEPYVAS